MSLTIDTSLNNSENTNVTKPEDELSVFFNSYTNLMPNLIKSVGETQSIASFMMRDSTYRYSLLYNIISNVIKEHMKHTFGDDEGAKIMQEQISTQVVIEKGKINITFYNLNRYLLNSIKMSEDEIGEAINIVASEAKLIVANSYNIYFKYRT